jgi:hypothetical protein
VTGSGCRSFIALDPHAENGGLGRKAFDPAQDLGEQGAWHRH